MRFKRHGGNKAGFTLIELLVVIAIIGILSGIVIGSLSTSRAKARDAFRKTSLSQVRTALELYYNEHGTYQVAGSGWTGCGCGWLGYEDGGAYVTAVTRVLYNEKMISRSLVEDPLISPSFMMYVCNGGASYALAATLEYPSAADITKIQTTCNGPDMYTTYGKNYALTNP